MIERLRDKGGAYALLHFSFFLYSWVTVFTKYAAIQAPFSASFFAYGLAMVAGLGLYALLWQQVLKRFPLSQAYSSKGVVIFWNMLWSALLFAERITWANLAGGAIIILGIFVGTSDES